MSFIIQIFSMAYIYFDWAEVTIRNDGAHHR